MCIETERLRNYFEVIVALIYHGHRALVNLHIY